MTEERREVKTNIGAFVVRRPTETEALALAQKRFNKKIERYSVDATDDGDEEVLACVVSPDRAQLDELLEDAPGLADVLEGVVNELGGGALDVTKGDPGAITDELRAKHGPRLTAAAHDGATYVLKKLTRTELKLVERRKDQMAAMAQLGRGHLVQGTIDSARFPMLAAQLGTHLVQLTRVKVEVEQGKSASSSESGPAPTS